MKRLAVVIICIISAAVLLILSAAVYDALYAPSTGSFTHFEKLEYIDGVFDVASNGDFVIITNVKSTGSVSVDIINFTLNAIPYDSIRDCITQNDIIGTTLKPGEDKTLIIELHKEKWKQNENLTIQIQTKEKSYSHTFKLTTSQSEEAPVFERLDYYNFATDILNNGNPIITFELKNTGTLSTTINGLSLRHVYSNITRDYVNQNVVGSVLHVTMQKPFFIELNKDEWKENDHIELVIQTSIGNKYPYYFWLETSQLQTSEPASFPTTLVTATLVIVVIIIGSLIYFKKRNRACVEENHKSSVIDKLKWALTLFEGEKTNIFWAGLIILSLASLSLFGILWTIGRYSFSYWSSNLASSFPLIVGAIVFILIGFYMMKSGAKKKSTPRIETVNAS